MQPLQLHVPLRHSDLNGYSGVMGGTYPRLLLYVDVHESQRFGRYYCRIHVRYHRMGPRHPYPFRAKSFHILVLHSHRYPELVWMIVTVRIQLDIKPILTVSWGGAKSRDRSRWYIYYVCDHDECGTSKCLERSQYVASILVDERIRAR